VQIGDPAVPPTRAPSAARSPTNDPTADYPRGRAGARAPTIVTNQAPSQGGRIFPGPVLDRASKADEIITRVDVPAAEEGGPISKFRNQPSRLMRLVRPCFVAKRPVGCAPFRHHWGPAPTACFSRDFVRGSG